MQFFFRNRPNQERGQAIIEFAFIAPILLVLLLVILDFGVAVDRREVIQHAVREGARQGAVGKSVAQIQTIASDQSQGVLEPDDVTVCYVDGEGGENAGIAGSNIRVQGTYTYRLFFGVELMEWWGMDPDTFSVVLDPQAEARMETSLAGVTECS
jgi:hypothetical protein